MAHPPPPARGTFNHGTPGAANPGPMPIMGPPGPPGAMGSHGMPRHSEANAATNPQHPVEEKTPSPPKDVYPCGCAYPGPHKEDCMWSLWEQMRDNYEQTKSLMSKFMTQVNTMQQPENQANICCACPPACHGKDLGEAMGLQQMMGVTVPWGPGIPMGTLQQGKTGPANYSVENEARKMMEEQRRIKNFWVQFLNIFDMALDLANDVSRDRWEHNRNRKERARLEREQKLEEMRRERMEREKGTKPSPHQKDSDDKKGERDEKGEKVEKGEKGGKDEKKLEKDKQNVKQENSEENTDVDQQQAENDEGNAEENGEENESEESGDKAIT